MRHILILKGDSLRSEAVRSCAARLFPRAVIVVANTLGRAEKALLSREFDLLLVGLDFPDGDALDFIFNYVKSLRRAERVLVITQHHEQWGLEMLRTWKVDGVFDPLSEEASALDGALTTVAGGQSYWSPRLRQQLETSISRGRSLVSMLTAAELAFIATIGDGTDDATAAKRLGITLATIQTVRRNVYAKLDLHDRADVMRFAVRHGFIRFSRGNIVRPAYEHMCAAYEARRPREKRSARLPKGTSKAA
jgi:DNA-binding NarL/FixJ family response regulator